MEQLHANEKNKQYYSEAFIKGFECGTERQFNADRDAYKQGFNDALEKAMSNTYKKFTDLSKDEIKQIVTDIFHPKKITNIETHKKEEEITCTIYTEWEGRDEETTLIADTLTLRNPFKYGEDAIEVDFSVNGSDYLKLKQFCFAKGIFHENLVKDNPYLQEGEKSIDILKKTEFHNNHKTNKEK